VSQAPVRAEDHAAHGASYSAGYKIVHEQVDSGVSWSGNERNVAFLNTGCGRAEGDDTPRFADASAAFGFDFEDDARGISSIDWDFDGDLDLIVTNRTGPRLRFLQNNSDGRGRFLVLKLIGKDGNRDAIGARAEVTLRKPDGKVNLVRTVYAGNGFISQSSKWLHFGLDREAELEQVVIRWPGGQREVFADIRADAHYVLDQGTGKAKKLAASTGTGRLAASPIREREISDAGSICLDRRLPLPPVHYTNMDGKQVTFAAPLDGPVLVNLWSKTCAPCLVELGEFAAAADQIRAAHLSILALNFDGAATPDPAAVLAATQFLDKIQFPFEAGMLNARSMEILHIAHNKTFLRPHQLPAPTSFLIDRNGCVAVVYRGPVPVDDLIRDVADLGDPDPSVWNARCWPFPGRWIAAPDRVFFLEIAIALINKEYLDEAADFLMQHRQQLSSEHDCPEMLMVCGTRLLKADKLERAVALLQGALEMNPELAEAHNNLATCYRRSGRDDLAEQHFAKAVELKPDYADARLNLATLLAAGGSFATALEQVDAVLASQPENQLALLLAGNLNLQLQEWQLAKTAFENLLLQQPEHVNALINLGGIHVQLGKREDAIRYYEKALKINPNLDSVRRSLTDLHRLAP
jgi:tetratricopeptide (TPR) repeat protein